MEVGIARGETCSVGVVTGCAIMPSRGHRVLITHPCIFSIPNVAKGSLIHTVVQE